MDGVKTLPAGFARNAAGVDDDLGPFHRRLDGVRIAHVRLHRLHLPDDAVGSQEAGEIGAADGGAHPPAGLGEGAHDVAADEAGAAEDGRQTIAGRGKFGHAALRGKMPPA